MSTSAIPGFGPGDLGGPFAAGLNALSLNQTVVFTRYKRLVLPVDGFVFWVNAALLEGSAIPNTLEPNNNTAILNAAPPPQPAPTSQIVQCALHFATERLQEEDQITESNAVMVTTQVELDFFNEYNPQEMWLGLWEGTRFAFSSRKALFQQTGTYHYFGRAVYAALESQIIDNIAAFDAASKVVSNSLPFWLNLNGYQPLYGFGNVIIPVFPSFAEPDNQPPPYISVHIEPNETVGLQSAPFIDGVGDYSQLVKDTVRLTMYGVRNRDALNFLACVGQYSLDYGYFGLMNMPVIRDEKRTQPEMAVLAQKKTVEFEVNYYQAAANQMSWQLIRSAIPTFYD